MKAFLRRLKMSVVILVITGGIYSIADNLFGMMYPPRPYDSHRERLTSPSYVLEPFFSEAFLIESFTQPGGWLTPDNTRLVLPYEFHGNYFNVDLVKPGFTYRRTINEDTSEEASHTVLVLGGSTIYNSEVPDAYTVPSLLSSILRSNAQHVIVINAGVTSVNSSQELERLIYELKGGLSPRIVITFDGVNDVYEGIYSNNPNGVMFSGQSKRTQKSSDETMQEVSSVIPMGMKELVPLHIYHALKIRALRENQRVIPSHMLDAQAVSASAQKTREQWMENILAMQKLAKQHGFSFYAFLQPNAFLVRADNNPDVELAIDLANHRTPKLLEAFTIGYPLLRDGVKELNRRGIKAYDLSELFQNKDENIFIDFCHVNSKGNQLIAEVLAKTLLNDEQEWRAR